MLSPYEQGVAAYYSDKNNDAKNPYKPYTQEHDDWAEGYSDAACSDKE